MKVEYNPEFYKSFRRFVKAYMSVVYNIDVTGLENINKDETYLFAGNHLNILDSWLLLMFVNRNIRFMVDKKLYKSYTGELFFKTVGTFPIDPNSLDITAVKTAISLLKNNENVAIFPEGRTHKITESVSFKPGVAAIANLSQKKLLPFGINGSYFPGSHLQINFGKPLDLSDIPKKEQDIVLEETVRKLELKK